MRRWQCGSWIIVAVGLAAAVPPRSTAADEPNRPNVILYLVDTLRADHLGIFGYDRDTSPMLDRWASEAVVFDQAYSPTSWTKSATVSLLSGLDPLSHRVEDRLDVIPAEVRLLSEYLKSQGYRTHAAITNPNVLPIWGFDRGFDTYRDLAATGRRTRADAVLDHVVQELPKLAKSQPFLLYLHLLDPHAPYDPPAPYDTLFQVGGGSRNQRTIAAYDGEIGFGDSQFGRLLDSLKANGLYDDTMILFVSDHGEELRDHGGLGHGTTLYQEVLRVPLLIKFPRSAHAGTRVRHPVSLIDVVPTVMSVLGRPPLPDLDGRDLTRLLKKGGPPWEQRDLFLSLDLAWTPHRTDVMRGILSRSHKYLRRVRPVASEAVFDLDLDPGEKKNLVGKHAEPRARLAAKLDHYLALKSRGIHLHILNDLAARPVGCRVVLRTTGRFVDVSGSHLEASDRLELSDDGRTLSLRCQLVNRPHPTGGVPRIVADQDGLIFLVSPPEAPIVVEALGLEGDRELPLRVGLKRRREALPFHFAANNREWAIRDIEELLKETGTPPRRAPMGAYLAVISPPHALDEVPKELRDRLRALGYLGGASEVE